MNRARLTKNTQLHEQKRHASSIRPMKNNFVRMKTLSLLFISIVPSYNPLPKFIHITVIQPEP
jgi:hypothetical protein